ncbi:hypothetical protein JCM14244_14790 [Venenivibrio stagnispumantis]|uniref:Lipopolysaccharide export LptBFGC system, permease protein LptF n=1 Tax=Venenivibrio stagnispumantis TaxID=407998 RepID=A0AA45WIZ1_9AQUI|nr:LptF/LptG family permease [Venenivibrio stagnispumantis]MCW4572541.1 LptF/LptG family permease [Venenivibrio stagnispumantis]SMP01626.1 Lipopolysaccharide export LptBFGC system, permease protein LptF [Venenivibrio stagnispumantis]
MKKLYIYLYQRLLFYILVVFPSFAFVSIFIELIEILRKTKILDYKLISLYILFKIPEKIYYILPLSVVISLFLTINEMYKKREIDIILINGISLKNLSYRFILFSIFVFFVQLINLEAVMSPAQKNSMLIYSKLKSEDITEEKNLLVYNLWLSYDENKFIYFDFLDLDKKSGKNFIFIQLDKDFKPVYKIESSSFNIKENDKIEVENAKFIKINSIYDFQIENITKSTLFISLDIDKIKKLVITKKPVSLSELYKIATIAQRYGYEALYYWSQFYLKLATVISPIILTIFILPFLWRNNIREITVGMIFVLFYWYIITFFSSLSESGVIPHFAIFTVDFAYAIIGFYRLFRLEN